LIDAMSAGRAFRVTDRKNLRSLAVGFEFAIADATRSPANQARLIMKKSTKSQKPAAPQATPAKKTVEPTPVKKAVAPKEVSRPKKAVEAYAAAAAATMEPPASAAVVAPVTPAATTIIAQIDVGFGNQLYLRGDGAGLSWDHGVEMSCVRDDQWSYRLEGATRPVSFKFLINDVTWSTGPDYTVAPEATVVLTPSF